MTHGDKSKAKKAASKASGNKKASGKTGKNGKSEAVKAAKSGKEAVKASPKAVKTDQKQQAGTQKSAAGDKTPAPKATAQKATAVGGGKARGPAPDPSGFTNPVVANAFKRAVKKFPNAFRRLTD